MKDIRMKVVSCSNRRIFGMNRIYFPPRHTNNLELLAGYFGPKIWHMAQRRSEGLETVKNEERKHPSRHITSLELVIGYVKSNPARIIEKCLVKEMQMENNKRRE